MSDGFCECGCGKAAPIATQTNRRRGNVKGQPQRYVVGHAFKKSGADHPSWRGGRHGLGGYVGIHMPSHPRANRDGYVREHILVAETALGKPLPPEAIPHHINGVRWDNRRRNLVLCENNAYHMLLHQRERALRACGHANWRKCNYCKQHDDPANLVIGGRGCSNYHRECRNRYRQEQRQQRRQQAPL